MAISVSKACVLKIYQDVMEDVIMNIRDLFLEDGIDEQVLQELQQAWENKLLASKAVDNHPPDLDKVLDRKPVPINQSSNLVRGPVQMQNIKQTLGQVAPNNHVQTTLGQTSTGEVKMVPVQITLPPQPGTEGGQRVLTIQVPQSALQGNQLHRALTGPVISATMSLPAHLASTVLQSHVDAVLNSQQAIPISTFMSKPPQTDGAADESLSDDEDTLHANLSVNLKPKLFKNLCMQQIDGPVDTSDEDDDASEDDDGSDEAEEDKEDEHDLEDEGGAEEEPLNSEDDVTDEDAGDQFDTENVVVCQYDKITRSRNKWKFHLKDGIMNCNNEDYIFQKANGDAEW